MFPSDKFVAQYTFMDKTEENLATSVMLTSDIDRNILYKKQCIILTFIVGLGHIFLDLEENVTEQINKNKCVDKFWNLLVNEANKESLKFLLDLDKFNSYLDVYNWFLLENNIRGVYYDNLAPKLDKLLILVT